MANRQYIGARYVPKLVGAWQANTFYEALSIVTDNNVSYTSKKPVPATVGSPGENPEYWVATGNYNAQMQQIIDDQVVMNGKISALEGDNTSNKNRLTALENKRRKYVLIGDSLGMGYSHETGNHGHGWVYYAKQALGESNCVYASIVGGGFTEAIPYNWLYQLQNADFSTIHEEDITDICVFGGSNDIDDTVANIDAAISAFITYCKTTFPNVERIRIGCFAEIGYTETIRQRYITCQKYGAEYIGDMENLLHNISLFDDTRHLHLSEAGYEAMSPYVIDCILYGKCDYTFRYKTTQFTGQSGNPHAINITNANATFEFTPKERKLTLGGILPADNIKVQCTIDGWYSPNRFEFSSGFLLIQDTSLKCYFPTHPSVQTVRHWNTVSGASGDMEVWVHERDASEYPDLLYVYLSANCPYQEEGTATVEFNINGLEYSFVN